MTKKEVFPYSLPSVGPGADPGVQACPQRSTRQVCTSFCSIYCILSYLHVRAALCSLTIMRLRLISSARRGQRTFLRIFLPSACRPPQDHVLTCCARTPQVRFVVNLSWAYISLSISCGSTQSVAPSVRLRNLGLVVCFYGSGQVIGIIETKDEGEGMACPRDQSVHNR